MGAYTVRRHLLMFFMVGYVAAALFGPNLGRSEFYPFFNWGLFSYTHSVRSDVVVLVHSINGKRFEEPVLYYDLPERFVHFPGGKVRLNKLLRDLRSAQWRGDTGRADELLGNIRDNYFLRVNSAEFEIAVIWYNPIGRYRNGKFIVTRTMTRSAK